MKVIITGATGLLGRAVYKEFKAAGWETIGVGFTRLSDIKVNLRDSDAVKTMVAEHQPDVIIHAAAERRPDVCEKDSSTEELNVVASWDIARAAAACSSHLIYISTDYMFDGKDAPYKETAEPHPLNAYGHLKLRGEHAVLAGHPRPFILRVPLLFGPTDDLNESACTMFAAIVKDAGKPATVDDWQIRVPTYTPDVGRTLVNISSALLAGGRLGVETATEGSASSEAQLGRQLRGIYNYTSQDRLTRYSLVQIFGRLMGCSTDHVRLLEGSPPGAPRPHDCHLDDSKLRATGLAAQNTPFEEAAKDILQL